MKKKLMSILLGSAIVIGSLAGCGGSGNEPAPEDAPEETAAGDETAPEETEPVQDTSARRTDSLTLSDRGCQAAGIG